ncbi:hypothetical protein [Desulfosporosinus fructosivorans]
MPAAAKEKQTVLERVELEVLLNQGCQSVDRLTHVGIPAGDVDFIGLREITEHDGVPSEYSRLILSMLCYEFPGLWHPYALR